MNIVNVGYHSTNYYVIADAQPRLLVDAGWPGSLTTLQAQCKRMGVSLPDVGHFLVTHFHPDHAGLIQELTSIGSQLVVIDIQAAVVSAWHDRGETDHQYVDIDLADHISLRLADSRSFLSGLGIQGEIIATPGHSDDSVSLVLDEGAAFTGDLTNPLAMNDDPASALYQSWERIRAAGVRTIYPGHGPVWRLK